MTDNDRTVLAWPWSISSRTLTSRELPLMYLHTATLCWAALYKVYITTSPSLEQAVKNKQEVKLQLLKISTVLLTKRTSHQ